MSLQGQKCLAAYWRKPSYPKAALIATFADAPLLLHFLLVITLHWREQSYSKMDTILTALLHLKWMGNYKMGPKPSDGLLSKFCFHLYWSFTHQLSCIWDFGIFWPMVSETNGNQQQLKLDFFFCLYVKVRQVIEAWSSQVQSHWYLKLPEYEVILVCEGWQGHLWDYLGVTGLHT